MPESPFASSYGSYSVILYLEPVLNSYYQNYQNILTLSDMPLGPLKNMVSKLQFPKLSPFSNSSCSTSCLYVLGRYTVSDAGKPTTNNTDSFMYADDIPSVLSYLQSNGYIVDTSLTTMLQKSEVRIGGGSGSGSWSDSATCSGNRRMICMFSYSE